MTDWVGVCGGGLPLKATTQLHISGMASIIASLHYHWSRNSLWEIISNLPGHT